MRLKSSEILQSHIRSYLVRKHKKNEERCVFDQIEDTGTLSTLLGKFLFFYDASLDKERMVCFIIHSSIYLKLKMLIIFKKL